MKPQLLCLHGWGYTGALWQPLAAALPDREVLAPTLDWQLGADALTDQLAASLDSPTLVLGWSLGAQLALQLAHRHPHTTAALYLIAASPCFVARNDWPHGLPAETLSAFRQQFASTPARVQQRFLALQLMEDAQRSALTPALQAALSPANTVSLPAGLAMLAEQDLRALPLPACPLQLLHGAQDRLMPLTAAEWLAERYTAPVEVIANAGHAPLFAEPAALAQRLQRLMP